MSNINVWKLIVLFSFAFILLGCESKEEQMQKALKQQITSAELDLADLGKALDQGHIRNAKILNQYGDLLKKQKPELTQIADLISLDSTREGPLFKSLVTRLNEIKAEKATLNSANSLFDRLSSLKEAASLSLFGDALTDPINVLADMSDGDLARIGAISKTAENAANKGQDYGRGSQLIGNPQYGNWQTNSSGMSFWEWYGMYALISNISSPIYYDGWSRSRRYSYYNDYGRSRYTSKKQYKAQKNIETKTRQSYKRQGKQFSSPYAKKRSGASSLSRSSYTPVKTKSSYSRTSSYAKNSGSVRNSSSRTSRGVSRGK